MKKKVLLFIALIVLLVPAFIFLVPVKDGRTIYKNIKYKQLLAGAIQPDNYDKMKISYARIVERKTGSGSFDDVSDMHGHDASEDDEYVRTHDKIYYTIEVGIERNEATTEPTDSFNSGVIKVKLILPEVNNNRIKLYTNRDEWARNYKYNSNLTQATMDYYIPVDKTPVGGNQQLTFTIDAGSFLGALSDEDKPKFEIWMEGNKPDNPDSVIDSIIVQDNDDLIITGETYASESLYDGFVNNGSTVNGVKGQFISLGAWVNTAYGKGKLTPVNNLNSKLKVKYYYKDATDENSEWIDISSVEGISEPLNGTYLYAYGRLCEKTEGFWANENNNCAKLVNGGFYWLRAKASGISTPSTWFPRESYFNYDSGVLTASMTGDEITFSNTDFYNLNNGEDGRPSTLASDGLELFVPWYEPENKNYDYKVEISVIEINVEGEDGENYSFTSNSMVTFNFKNYFSGEIRYELEPAYGGYFNKNSVYNYLGSISYNAEFVPIPFSRFVRFESDVNAVDGPYEGGLERLIAWNRQYAAMFDGRYDELTYSNSTVMPSPTVKNDTIMYGIYKQNPNEGLTTNELVNSCTIDDFDWYETKTLAKQYGVITAVKIDEPDYKGYGIASEYIISLEAVQDISNLYQTGIITQKIKICIDEEKTNCSVFDEPYTATLKSGMNSDQTIYGSPTKLGETFFINGPFMLVDLHSTDMEGTREKDRYNVEEEVMNLSVNPVIETGISIPDTTASFELRVNLPEGFSYVEGSATIEPDEITSKIDGSAELIWYFANVQVNDGLPIINFQVDISPYIPNSTSKRVEAQLWAREGKVAISYINSSKTFYITNLSGSSLRNRVSKPFVEKSEQFEINDSIYNISQSRLENFKSVELLPKNGDDFGTSYNGSYILRVLELADTQKMYYTTNPINNIGLVEDNIGKLYLDKTINLDEDSRWIGVNVNEFIPDDATAIATYIPEISPITDINYKLQFLPTNNEKGDKYYFQMFGSSDNLENAISSEIKIVTVVDRRISGTVFEDLNRNDLLNDTDAKLNNYTIQLLNETGGLLDETTTNSNGRYEFSLPDKGNYIIQVANLPDGYELIPKGTTADSNRFDNTLRSDLIDQTGVAHNAIEEVGNINLGIRKKPATLVVKYLDKNDNHPLVDQTEETVYYTDNYETHGLTTIPENYSFLETAGAPVADVVNSDYIEVIYYYDFTPATITAKHYIDGTSTKIHEDVIQNKKLTQPYSTSVLDTTNLNYEYVRTDGDSASGTVDKTEIVVNYYYKLKKGTVTTHHYLYNNGETTTKLAPDVTREWNYTDTYTTSVSDQVPQNYEFYKKSNNYTSVMGSPSVEVSYYYRLKNSSLTTSINIVGTEEITSKDTKVDYTITYNAKVVDYIGNGIITINDTLPYDIDVDNSDLDGGVYNPTDRSISWEIDWSDIDTYAGRDETTITKTISVKYNGIVGRDRIMTNNVHSNILLSNSTRDAEAQTSTNIRINGNIKVIYIDKDTGEEIADAVEETNLVGEEFISSAIEKEGYKLVTKPDSETFEFEEEDQLITYEYKHIKFEIKGKVLGVGGRIRGDEDVYWGDDSTEGNIIVEADDGYIIEAILVNGERMDIEPGQVTIVLENFKEVLENKNIEVIFAKKPQENPNTKAFIGLIILISWLILFTNAILLKKSQELE